MTRLPVFAVALSILFIGPGPALAGPDGDEERVAVIVTVDNPLLRAPFLERLGAEVTYTYRVIPAIAASVPAPVLERLASQPWVVQVEPDAEVTITNDLVRDELDAEEVWSAGYTGAGVTAAIIDTGIDTDNPDFRDRILAGRQFSGGVGFGVYEDDNGHGTHVAGTLGGTGAANDGITAGVAPGVEFVIVKALGASGSGLTSDIVAGIDWVVAVKAQYGIGLLSMSLSAGCSGSCTGSSAMSRAADAASDAGIVVLASAGNSGPGTLGSPGDGKKVITVGAVDDRSTSNPYDDTVADFSAGLVTGDGRVKPDVVAPGVSIRSSSHLYPVYRATTKSGTSMATPAVAGIVALLLEKEPGLTPAQVLSRLCSTALTLPADPTGPSKDTRYGCGFVHGPSALRLA